MRKETAIVLLAIGSIFLPALLSFLIRIDNNQKREAGALVVILMIVVMIALAVTVLSPLLWVIE